MPEQLDAEEKAMAGLIAGQSAKAPPTPVVPYDLRARTQALRAGGGGAVGGDAFTDTMLPLADDASSDYVVQTTFDARPLNAIDTVFLGQAQITPLTDPAVLRATITYTVPEGYIAVIKRVKWTSSQLLFIPSDGLVGFFTLYSPFALTLAVNDANQLGYQAVQAQEFDSPCYILADSGQRVQAKIFGAGPGSGIPTANWAPLISVQLYGNLLVNSSRELQYEPANQYTADGRFRSR